MGFDVILDLTCAVGVEFCKYLFYLTGTEMINFVLTFYIQQSCVLQLESAESIKLGGHSRKVILSNLPVPS